MLGFKVHVNCYSFCSYKLILGMFNLNFQLMFQPMSTQNCFLFSMIPYLPTVYKQMLS